MKRFLLILFLLCFSITNTAFAEGRPIGEGFNCFKANGPEIVSASKADFAVRVVYNNKNTILAETGNEGLVSFCGSKMIQEINRCRKKWVWRSSKLYPYEIKTRLYNL